MLTRTAEYALRAVVVLARHYGEAPVSNEEIARVLGAPRNYLSKTMHALSRRGIVAGTRGPGGGFSLAVPPDALTIADIADVFADAVPHAARCLIKDGPCDPRRPCIAHRRWTEIQDAARAPLRRSRISDLCSPPLHPPTQEHRS